MKIKRYSIIIAAALCLFLPMLAGCGNAGDRTESLQVQQTAPADEPDPGDSDEYAKLLGGAGANDLLMVYYDPPQDVVSQANARLVDPEEETGENILLVNVSSTEIVWEYYELSAEPETPGTQLWKDNLVPGEAVLLNSLYSEGIPNRRIYIYAGNDEEEYWEYMAGYDLTYDGAGTRGPVFVKTGDYPPAGGIVFNPDEPAFFAFAYTYNLEDDEYYYPDYPDGFGEDEQYIYFTPDGTGLLSSAGEVTFIGWDKDFIYIGNDLKYIYEINPATSELVFYGEWGKDFYQLRYETPESVTQMYDGFLEWFEEEAVG